MHITWTRAKLYKVFKYRTLSSRLFLHVGTMVLSEMNAYEYDIDAAGTIVRSFGSLSLVKFQAKACFGQLALTPSLVQRRTALRPVRHPPFPATSRAALFSNPCLTAATSPSGNPGGISACALSNARSARSRISSNTPHTCSRENPAASAVSTKCRP